ncbi:hypothetical protein BC628DRAFT_262458 [Trametes gibbosa]|nr:hypothetical protein BC628DRAFT_262458 [Trametes gibbosa]
MRSPSHIMRALPYPGRTLAGNGASDRRTPDEARLVSLAHLRDLPQLNPIVFSPTRRTSRLDTVRLVPHATASDGRARWARTDALPGLRRATAEEVWPLPALSSDCEPSDRAPESKEGGTANDADSRAPSTNGSSSASQQFVSDAQRIFRALSARSRAAIQISPESGISSSGRASKRISRQTRTRTRTRTQTRLDSHSPRLLVPAEDCVRSARPCPRHSQNAGSHPARRIVADARDRHHPARSLARSRTPPVGRADCVGPPSNLYTPSRDP